MFIASATKMFWLRPQDSKFVMGTLLMSTFPPHTLLQMCGFFTNLLSPITVDKSPEWHHPPQITSLPVLNNVLLVLIFSVLHRYTSLTNMGSASIHVFV